MTARFLEAPVIETGRLRLRGFQVSDFDAYCATLGKPDVMRYISSDPQSREQIWGKFLRPSGWWPLYGFGMWWVELLSDNSPVGHIGYGQFMRDMTPSLGDMPELGWIFDSDYHGQGYANEALAAALAWGDAHIAADRFCCIISPENQPSLRLAARQGFVAVCDGDYHGNAVRVFER